MLNQPIVDHCEIAPHRVYSLEEAHRITGISRKALRLACESGVMPHLRFGKSHIQIGGLAILIALGMPPPQVAPTPPPATESTSQRRHRGKSALDTILKKGTES
jgi:hypothetical protein